MTAHKIDPEQLAALLDGRLDDATRADVLSRLAASQDDVELFADAAAIMGEVSPAPAPAHPAPTDLPRVARWPARRWLTLAAGIAGIAIWLTLRARTGQLGSDEPHQLLASLDTRARGLPPNWDGAPWVATRGIAPPLTPDARAARLGAALTDLTLASQSHDPRAPSISESIAALLIDIPGGAPAAALYHQVARLLSADSTAAAAPLISQGWQSVTQLTDAPHLRLGAWLEAARIAATNHDPQFFAAPQSRAVLDDALAQLPPTAPARTTISDVRNQIRDTQTVDWLALAQSLDVAYGSLAAP